MQEIVAAKRIEIRRQQEVFPSEEAEKMLVPSSGTKRSMSRALSESSTGILAEFKRRSPSKGWIRQEARAEDIIPAYERSGATALSVLTDEPFFGGTLRDLREARRLTGLPILRKDFIISEYQLIQASLLGADAVLLIAACLTPEECRRLARTAHSLHLEVLLEIHDEQELDYIDENIDMLGVNNRNLGTFHTDADNSFRLAAQLPKDLVRISESGLSSADTIRRLREAGYSGFLIGETFMKAEYPAQALQQLLDEIRR